MLKYFSYTTLCLFIIIAGKAQIIDKGETKIGLHYNYGMPLGSFKSDFMDKTSARGLSIDIMHHISNKIAVGVVVGYQDFYLKMPRKIYPQNDGSDVSAVISNSVQTIPVMAKAQYFFGTEKENARVLPYVSLGAGANMVQYEQLFGALSNGNDVSFHFAAQAGAGARFPFGKEKANSIFIGGNFNYMPYGKFGVENLNHASVQAGIQIRLRDDGEGRNNRFSPGPDRYDGRYRNW